MRCQVLLAMLVTLSSLPGSSLPCFGQGAKSNTLTAAEVAAGWIQLFDGETTFGWQIRGDAKVVDGTLAMVAAEPATFVSSTAKFGDFELRFQYRQDNPPDKNGVTTSASVVVRQTGGSAAGSLPGSSENMRGWNEVVLRVEGPEAHLKYSGPGGVKGRFGGFGGMRFKTVGSGPRLVEFQCHKGTTLAVKDVKLKPLGVKSIFNGTDLTGWKEHPGKKSKFTVTDKGEINVKDGPGDLQSEGQWAHFILQLDCISHGKHLNSGVFFRCRPGDYQQGYEAQIRNQFTVEATQEYKLDEYDPQTNKKTGEKKIKSTAVDFGTGAIYRRMPARREVAKDNEWFTMTVFAQGRHLATWVNGVQVVDWTDHRPLSDNARTGCRLEAGNISFQGHDPTTNLSFRNIRIVELPNEGKK